MSLFQRVAKLFGSKQPVEARRKSARRRQLRIESLENRRVFDASFDSLLTVGNDTASIQPWDNAVDSAGNNYVAGAIYGEIDLDPAVDRTDGSDILTPRGTSDGYVVKYGPQNEFLWARRMGGDFLLTNANDPIETIRKLAVDSSGNVYVTGFFVGQAEFGATQLTSTGNADAFVSKLSANGDFVWAKSWGSTSREWGYDVAVDGSGNVYSVGATSSLTSTGAWTHQGAEIRKYSSNGSLVWSKSLSGTGMNATSVSVDSAGTTYVSGNFAGTVDMNPDPKKTNAIAGSGVVSGGAGRNSYVLKLSSTGTYVSAAPFIANTTSDANSMVNIGDTELDANGSLILGGSVRGVVDLNPSSSVTYSPSGIPATGSIGFVEKLNSSLNFTWASLVAGDAVINLAVRNTEIYTVGQFSGTMSFGGVSYTSNGVSDVIVNRVNSTGGVDWVVSFGGTGSDLGNGIAVDAAGTLSIIGTYRLTADFDPDPIAKQERTNDLFSDMYLLKLRQSV